MDPLLPRLEDEERRRRAPAAVPAQQDPRSHAGAELLHPAQPVRRTDGHPHGDRAALRDGHRAGRHRRPARWRRRTPGARPQGAIAVRRRARQPRRLRQLRRGAGGDRVHLGTRQPAARLRLDRGAGVRAGHGAAARALQHHARGGEAEVAVGLLHRHAGAGRRHHRAAAALSRRSRAVRRAQLALADRLLHGWRWRPCSSPPSRPSRASSWASGSRASSCCRCSWAWPRWWRCSSPIPTAR